MQRESVVARLSRLAAPTSGAFHVRAAANLGITRTQLARLAAQDVIERLYPSTYRMTAVPATDAQRLRGALLWAGDDAAAAGRSAATRYGLEGVRVTDPEVALPYGRRSRPPRGITVVHGDPRALMARSISGIRTTGIEATLLRLAHLLDPEPFEIAFEDARRRRLTSMPAINAYLTRFARQGRPGVGAIRALLRELDPVHASRSTLEVLTRRLLVTHGHADFEREFPLTWNGRTYHYDFSFERTRTILETNGRRWHDDPSDYEHTTRSGVSRVASGTDSSSPRGTR